MTSIAGKQEKAPPPPPPQEFISSSHSSQLLCSLQTMREEGVLFDVELEVDGCRLKAHSTVLAAVSPYFRAMFSAGMAESSSRVVHMKGVNPKAIQYLVEFAYTARLTISSVLAPDLLLAADMLHIVEARTATCDFLHTTLTPANCLDTLFLAEAHHCPSLQRAASLYCSLHFTTVTSQPAFLELGMAQVEDYLNSDHLLVDGEEEVLEAALRWIRHDEDHRSPLIARLLHLVRLPLLTPQALLDRVRAEPLVASSPDCMDLLWKTLTILIHPTTCHQMTVPKQRRPLQVLCALGGWDGMSVTPTVEWYDPELRHWSPGPPMTYPRKRFSVATLDGRVYAIGGHSGDKLLSSAEVYDQDTRVWTMLPSMQTARMFAGCAVACRKVYVIGGQCSLDAPLSSVEVFHPVANKWLRMASLHTKQSCPSVVSLNDILYALGRGPGGWYSVEVLYPDQYNWILVHPSLPLLPYRRYSAVVTSNSNIYIVGGSGRRLGGGRQDEVRCYSPNSNQLHRLPPLGGGARVGLGAAVLNGKLVAVGGHRDQEKLSSAEEYDFNCKTWQSLPSMSQARTVLGVVAVTKLV